MLLLLHLPFLSSRKQTEKRDAETNRLGQLRGSYLPMNIPGELPRPKPQRSLLGTAAPPVLAATLFRFNFIKRDVEP